MKGKIIDNRYEIIDVIGTGGLSEIYKALDKNTGKLVAMKFIRRDSKDKSEIIDCFDCEIDAIKRIDHPLIANLLYVGISDEAIPFMVIEYVEGRTLKQYILEKKHVDTELAINIAGSVLGALKHAHKAGIVHGDIKPQNILLGSDYIKLTDFGASKIVLNNLQHDLSGDSNTFGSVNYCSPEQLTGGRVTAKSDLYSLGIVLYEMLCGCLPFEAANSQEVARKNKEESPRAPSELNPKIPKALENFILRALEKNPENRFQSAESMEQALRSVRLHKNDKANMMRERELKKDVRTVKKPLSKKTIFIYAVALLCFVSFFVFSWMVFDKFLHETQAPYLIGEKEESAKRLVFNAKLNPRIVRESSEFPLGTVIRQSHPFGTKLRMETELVLVISTGPDMQAVPQLIGRDAESAALALEKLGLKTKIGKKLISSRPVGEVIRQIPSADTLLAFGESVELEISGGSFTMPNLLGVSRKEAIGILEAVGISKEKIKISEVKVDDKSQFGKVASQLPSEKTILMPTDENIEIVLAIYVQGEK